MSITDEAARLASDAASLPNEFVFAVRVASSWKHPAPGSPVAPDERQQLHAALHQLDDDERFVLSHRFSLDGCERLTNRAIWQARGWKSNRTTDVQRRALRRLAEAVYVPPLPPVGSWVRIGETGGYCEPAVGTPLRVVSHKDRCRLFAAAALPYVDQDGRDLVAVGHSSEGEEVWHTLTLNDMTPMNSSDAIPHALAIPNPFDRVDALIGLAAHLEGHERVGVLRTAANAAVDIEKPADRYALTRCLTLCPELAEEALRPAALSVVDYLAYVVVDDEAVPFIAQLRTRVPVAYQQLLRRLGEIRFPSPRGHRLLQLATTPLDVDLAAELRHCCSLASSVGASVTTRVLGWLCQVEDEGVGGRMEAWRPSRGELPRA